MKKFLGKRIDEEIRAGRTLVSDGAWGTMLIERGLQSDECPEKWSISHPDQVRAIGEEYIQAGADIIETNSFGANRLTLDHYGLSSQATEINKCAAILSREAAGPQTHVMGSVGPTGKILMTGDVTEQELYEVFSEQIVALEQGYADAVCIETMSAIDEACLAIRAAKENTALEIICSFTYEKTVQGEYKTIMGISPSDAVSAALQAGADIIGTNCGNGSEQMVDIVKDIRSAFPDVPILVHANAGSPVFVDGRVLYPEDPRTMSEYALTLLESGANIIGGCCGTTPEHIRAISHIVSRLENDSVKK